MARTFNCGIGMVLIVDPSNVAQIKQLVDEPVYEMGHLVDLSQNNGEHVKMVDMDSKW